jgi:hypothetical protein
MNKLLVIYSTEIVFQFFNAEPRRITQNAQRVFSLPAGRQAHPQTHSQTQTHRIILRSQSLAHSSFPPYDFLLMLYELCLKQATDTGVYVSR